MISKKKVLIVAYACEPFKTSEPGVGWNFSNEISNFMDVTVLTRSNNQSVIESQNNPKGINYLYFDLPNVITRYKKIIPFGVQLYYKLWQRQAYRSIKQRINQKEIDVDVIHHLTFGTTKDIPPIYKFEIPFIWGPIGGGDKIPFSFLKEMGFHAIFSEFIYVLLHLASDFSPFSFLTRKKAKAIVFRTESSLASYPKNGCKNRFLLSETAVVDFPHDWKKKPNGDSFNFLCIGRIMHGKGYMYALKGFQWFIENGGKGKLRFFGEGPQEEELKRYVIKNKLKDLVEFNGFVPNEEVKEALLESHVLLHPSFREGGSWAIMEAMSHGLPVVCFNTSGPKDMVTENCGYRIKLSSPNQAVKEIGKTILFLHKNEELYHELSKNCVSRIKDFYNWPYRREQIKKVYEFVLDTKLNE